MERKPVLDLNINLGGVQGCVDRIVSLASEERSAFVCLANVHMTVEAYRNPVFVRTLNRADLVVPDGMPLVHAMRWLHGVQAERVAGVDLLQALLKEAEARGLRVYFYGETESVLSRLKERIQQEFPLLRIVGAVSPPFRTLSASEELQNVAAINDAGAQLVLVALGCPRQETWMGDQQGRVQGVMIGVGAALSVYAGVRQRAPAWMRRYCLEWLYRLLQEPRRLARRYLVTNTLFMFLLGWQILGRRFWQSSS